MQKNIRNILCVAGCLGLVLGVAACKKSNNDTNADQNSMIMQTTTATGEVPTVPSAPPAMEATPVTPIPDTTTGSVVTPSSPAMDGSGAMTTTGSDAVAPPPPIGATTTSLPTNPAVIPEKGPESAPPPPPTVTPPTPSGTPGGQ